MHIGIDCRGVVDQADGNFAGVGYYTVSLIQALVEQAPQHTFILFVKHERHVSDAIHALALKKNVEVVSIADRGSIPFWTSHVVLARAVRAAKCDIFHATAYVAPLTLRDIPIVVTVHDLSIYEHPEWFAAQSPVSKRLFVPRTIRRAKAIIAVSQATARHIVERFPEVEQRIHVIYEAAVLPQMMMSEMEEMISGLRQYHGMSQRYLFFVGTIEPRKNLARVVRAFQEVVRRLYATHPELAGSVQLILAGKLGWRYEDFLAALRESSIAETQIKWIDYVSQSEKFALMSHADAVVMASLDEGFGLPALEAMELGTPVIASIEGALPEVTGGHALMVDPYDEQSIADAIERVIVEPQSFTLLTRDAQQHAKQFTWTNTAQETLQLYDAVTGR